MNIHQNYKVAYTILVITICLDFLKNIFNGSFSGIGNLIFTLCFLFGIFMLARIVRKGRKWPGFIFASLIILEMLTIEYKFEDFNKEFASQICSLILILIETTSVFFIFTAPKQIEEKAEDNIILDYNMTKKETST